MVGCKVGQSSNIRLSYWILAKMVILAKFWHQLLNEMKQPICKDTSPNTRSESMLEGKAVNASQAFNHCKHMVWICKEAMARNHSLRSCKPPVCNWKQSVDSRE